MFESGVRILLRSGKTTLAELASAISGAFDQSLRRSKAAVSLQYPSPTPRPVLRYLNGPPSNMHREIFNAERRYNEQRMRPINKGRTPLCLVPFDIVKRKLMMRDVFMERYTIRYDTRIADVRAFTKKTDTIE